MKLESLDISLMIGVSQDEAQTLPTSIVNCYNNLCKYAKPDSTDIGISYDNCKNKIELYVTLICELQDGYVTHFTEGEDFELTADERTAVINIMMDTVTKNILSTV